MNENQINALVSSLQAQRNAAFDAIVQKDVYIAQLQVEFEAVKAELEALKPSDAASEKDK